MSDVVIQIEGLSKQYRLGEVSTGSLHHDLNRWWHRVRGRPDPYLKVTAENRREENKRRSEYVWALRDIHLEVRRGEALGIIGANGAGKSTLLKILSRITAPTVGEARIRGRIGALLEIGTGFHQDLTGRENIFLNGAILGMTRAEIRRKLDEIVEFSGCAAYLDTPVKRYSSGMVVRLGFAVAAHLEPEILIVDEVLAVGDAEFQQKCLGKMSDVASRGRTVLFVSHNLSAIQQLCSSAVLLRAGRLSCGPCDPATAVQTYLRHARAMPARSVRLRRGNFELESVLVTDADGRQLTAPVPHDETHFVEIAFRLDSEDPAFCIGYELFDRNGEVLFVSMSSDAGPQGSPPISSGPNRLRCRLPAYLLNEGEYQIGVIAYYHGATCLVNPHKDDVRIPFSVRLGPGRSPYWNRRRLGALAPLLTWERAPDAPAT